jgi:hypothetical protein
MGDFMIVGVTAVAGVYDPRTALLPSLHNPHRALLTECVITSNNRHVDQFVLVATPEGNDLCYDALESVLLAKASFLKRRRSRSPSRTRITYQWLVIDDDEKHRLAVLDTTPPSSPKRQALKDGVGQTEGEFAYDDDATSCEAWVLQQHQNKFGTPLPGRRGLNDTGDMGNSDVIIAKAEQREARMSNDSVIGVI